MIHCTSLTTVDRKPSALSGSLFSLLVTSGVIFQGPAPIAAEPPPIVFERARLVASDPGRDDFGDGGIAVDGDTMVIGARYAGAGGRANVFERLDGVWVETMVLAGSDVEGGDRFGDAVAISGDLIFVGAREPLSGHLTDGAPRSEGGFDLDAGEVYVFQHGVEVAKIESDDARSRDGFGWTLAFSEGQLFVGARSASHPTGSRDGGAVYVFEQGEGGVTDWRQVQKITMPIEPDAEFENFSAAIAASGDHLLISSTGGSVPGAVDDVVWAYARGPLGDWQFEALLSSSENEPDAGFGERLAIDGETAVLGALDADGVRPDVGAAFVFERDPVDGWREVAKLSQDVVGVRSFGYGMAIDGDRLVVTAGASGPFQGAAFVYRRDEKDPHRWHAVATLLASDGEALDWLGYGEVALGDESVFLPVSGDDTACDDCGAVYLFSPME